MKALVLCADDFAQSPGINRGILRLLRMGRLQAVSCFAESPLWPESAPLLREFRDQGCSIGLHFNLTHPFARPARRIGAVMAAAWCGNLAGAEVKHAFDAQWEAFVTHFGRVPDHVDGHQHVHAFPGVREIVAARVAALSPLTWVRSLECPVDSWKAALLAHANRGLRWELRARGLASNDGFRGLRPYRPGFDFPRAVRRWMGTGRNGALVMCHPGDGAPDEADPLGARRIEEFGYLSSENFAEDSRQAGVVWQGRRLPQPEWQHSGHGAAAMA